MGGADLTEWLLLGTTNWLTLLLLYRLLAPAVLRTTRQQQQWREPSTRVRLCERRVKALLRLLHFVSA